MNKYLIIHYVLKSYNILVISLHNEYLINYWNLLQINISIPNNNYKIH
jgi:hypothetical protein